MEGELFTQHSKNWAGAGIDLTFSADSVTVPAQSSASVTVTVTPQAAFASYANANAPKGTFIDVPSPHERRRAAGPHGALHGLLWLLGRSVRLRRQVG